MTAQDQRTPTQAKEPKPVRIPEWLRRMQEGQLKAKDMTGSVTL